MRKRLTILVLLFIVSSLIFGISGVAVTKYLIESRKTQQEFNELSSLTDNYGEESEEEAEAKRRAAYKKLKEINPDYVGWLRVKGTNIDYPVVQSSEDMNPEYYLDHGFDREYSVYGVPFLDVACDVKTSNNLIIYGHRMTDKSMFHEVANYADPAFYEKHKELMFITEEGSRKYEVVAVFRYDTDNESFRFTRYTDMDMISFREFMENIHKRELYSTATDAVYGDRLITLSTCDYVYNNGRIVLVAKEVK